MLKIRKNGKTIKLWKISRIPGIPKVYGIPEIFRDSRGIFWNFFVFPIVENLGKKRNSSPYLYDERFALSVSLCFGTYDFWRFYIFAFRLLSTFFRVSYSRSMLVISQFIACDCHVDLFVCTVQWYLVFVLWTHVSRLCEQRTHVHSLCTLRWFICIFCEQWRMHGGFGGSTPLHWRLEKKWKPLFF